MRVLLVGSGAREHSIAECIIRSRHAGHAGLFSFMSNRNPGIMKLSEKHAVGKVTDVDAVIAFAKENSVTYAVIGPEAPLAAGIVDALEKEGIVCFGPRKRLAQLETSKSFTRQLMQKYAIEGNVSYQVFNKETFNEEEVKKRLSSFKAGFVVKPDGLTGGKGVKVSGEHLASVEDAIAYCRDVLKSHPHIVVEEKLEGEEFSLQCITDGETVLSCPPAQDHKRAYADDKGPNTGGMGSYSCAEHLLPFLDRKDIEQALEITRKVVNALFQETGERYKGVIYGGFMLTRAGVRLVEYNARFGDPEAMNVLPLMKTDFLEILEAMRDDDLQRVKLEFENKATVCKYAVPEGYPANPCKGEAVDASAVGDEANLFFAAIDEKEGKNIMTGSRAIAVVGIADRLSKAEQQAQAAIEKIKGPIEYRRDIGTDMLIQKRVLHMKYLREG